MDLARETISNMITFEIAFEMGDAALHLPDSRIGLEVDDSMKSDKSPSTWESDIFSRLSGKIIHIFDRKFIGLDGYRALYDDIIDERGRIRFKERDNADFFAIVESCLRSSKGGKVYICTDIQFGPSKKLYKPISLNKFISQYLRFGIRLNSCVEVRIK